jgi:hypothetical protein
MLRAAKDIAEQRIIGAIEAQFDIHAMDAEDFAEMWVEISKTLDELTASVDRSPEGQDAQRLDAKHESAVGSEASETPHTSQNTPKETSHD